MWNLATGKYESYSAKKHHTDNEKPIHDERVNAFRSSTRVPPFFSLASLSFFSSFLFSFFLSPPVEPSPASLFHPPWSVTNTQSRRCPYRKSPAHRKRERERKRERTKRYNIVIVVRCVVRLVLVYVCLVYVRVSLRGRPPRIVYRVPTN